MPFQYTILAESVSISKQGMQSKSSSWQFFTHCLCKENKPKNMIVAVVVLRTVIVVLVTHKEQAGQQEFVIGVALQTLVLNVAAQRRLHCPLHQLQARPRHPPRQRARQHRLLASPPLLEHPGYTPELLVKRAVHRENSIANPKYQICLCSTRQ